MSEAKRAKVGLLTGSNANYHQYVNERIESIFEFIISINLVVCNVGNMPTETEKGASKNIYEYIRD